MRLRSFQLAVAAAAAIVLVAGGAAPTGSAARSQETRPVLSPIEAEFDASERRTDYTVTLSNPASSGIPEWEWTFTADPADPRCALFSEILFTATASVASFSHGDEDGCRHVTPDHDVTIEVVVDSGPYTCNARITGTLSHTGPLPEPCFRRTAPPPPPPPPPPVPPAAPPTMSRAEKDEWAAEAGAASSFGASLVASAIYLALTPTPDPVTKGGAVICLAAGAAFTAAGGLFASLASDPPDPNYRVLARPAALRPRLLRAGGGVTRAQAAGANALLSNSAAILSRGRALVASLERAQGAHAARDGEWDRRQSQAAARFARETAKLLDARPALRLALRRSLGETGARRIQAADARRARARIARAGLPGSFVAQLRSLGFSGAEIASVRSRVAKVSASAATGAISAKVAPAAASAGDRRAARRLRALAAALARR